MAHLLGWPNTTTYWETETYRADSVPHAFLAKLIGTTLHFKGSRTTH